MVVTVSRSQPNDQNRALKTNYNFFIVLKIVYRLYENSVYGLKLSLPVSSADNFGKQFGPSLIRVQTV